MKYKKRKELFFDNETVLATFLSRFMAMLIDLALILLFFMFTVIVFGWLGFEIKHLNWNNFSHVEVEANNISEKSLKFLKILLGFVPIIYFTLTTYFTNGQSLGKKIAGIKIVSIYHQRIGLWHCIERSLGYAASTLELGIGFFQIFWNPNRMALHDRIAETMVIKVIKRKKK